MAESKAKELNELHSPFRIVSYNYADGSPAFGIIRDGNTSMLAHYNSYEQAEISLDALNESYREGLINR